MISEDIIQTAGWEASGIYHYPDVLTELLSSEL